VLHIIKSLGRGGAEMLLQETLKYHDRESFEFHYIYFLPWKHQMVEGIRKEGGIVTNFSASNNIRIMMKYRQILEYIHNNNIDLIHCHLPWAGFLGRLLHQLSGIPVLYTEHNKQERYHFITRTLNKLTFNRQTLAIAVSQDVASSIQKNIQPSIPVRTILNGVNVELFKRNEELGRQCRAKYGIPQDAILLGNVAVFRSQKRLKEWVTLFSKVRERVPNVKACLVGEGLLRQEIEEHISQSGVANDIILPGLQTDVHPWLSAIDIFVMTSEFEGLPIALLEAMSMGCAAVCTDAGGIKEVIRNQTDGIIFPVADWQKMEEELVKIIQDPLLLDKWKGASRKRVEESFNIRNMVQETEKLYHTLIDAKQ
jgi:glycosyltransferase involved in cell wall biosynthesis